RDGLDDIVIGVKGPDGSKVMVFEGPLGACRAKPEVFDLPDEVTSLALGHLDGEYTMDLAAAAGRGLLIVHGRDRKLSLDSLKQAEVKPARIEKRAFPFTIASISFGSFTTDSSHNLALLGTDGAVRLLSPPAQRRGLPATQQSPGIAAWRIQEQPVA